MCGNSDSCLASKSSTHNTDSILLHMCCGPCAVMPIRRLQDMGYAVTGWFMNPNIHPLNEYLRRREAAMQCASYYNIDVIFVDDSWNITQWLRSAVGRDTTPERCYWCCASRVEATQAAASALGFAWFSTSLLYSRYQPHEYIATIGNKVSQNGGAQFFYQDFRKDWQMGIDRSKEIGLYRQSYCGCIYSEADRYCKKLKHYIKMQHKTDLGMTFS